MNKDAHELFLDYQKNDRKFRLFQSFFMLAILALLLVVIIAQFQTLGKVEGQLEEQKRVNEATTKQSEVQRDQILRRLDCMTLFFSQKNRDNLSITNVQECSINKSDNPEQFFAPQSDISIQQPVATEPSKSDTAPATPPTTTSSPPEPEAKTPLARIEEFVEDALKGTAKELNKLIGGQ